MEANLVGAFDRPLLHHLVTFRLDRQTYALPIEAIVQIIPMLAITPLPQACDALEGIINVRGELVPVINLRSYLGMPVVARKLHTPILLVKPANLEVGLIVDEVLDVVSLSEPQVARSQDILPAPLSISPLLAGLVKMETGALFVLDLNRLFQPGTDLAEAVYAASAADAETGSTGGSSGAVGQELLAETLEGEAE